MDTCKKYETKFILKFVKKTLGTPSLRHSQLGTNNMIAWLYLGDLVACHSSCEKKKVDAYITADLKYHDFYEGNQSFLVVDAGHYETEQHTKKLILNYLTEKLPNFAILTSEMIDQ